MDARGRGLTFVDKIPPVSTSTQVQIGSDFLGYRIEELIGQGGMGVVYRAYDLRLKRTVALKLIVPELALDERFHARFARETELAMSLEHPNVVPVYDAGDVDGRFYLAMRLVEGTDLGALLRAEGALDPARALAICGQVANALDAAHGKDLVHRDVKPSNVLLDKSEHVYLADFGLTRRLEEQGAQAGEGRSVGTPAYLAPEQIEGGPVDGRADIYSLGCLLYECLTGEAPFSQDSRLAIAWAHLEEEPPNASAHNSDLPGAVDAVIRKAMAKSRDDRYPTCSALIAAGEEALELRQPPMLRMRRRPVLAAAATLVVVAAALAAALVMRNDGQSAVSVPTVHENSLVRIDPATNAISDVVAVGGGPFATAVGGHSVWVYNYGDATITEIDATTNEVRQTTPALRHPRRPRPSHRTCAGGRLGGRMDRRRRPEREAAPHENSLERTRETRVPPRPRAESGRGRRRRALGPRQGYSRQSGAACRPSDRRRHRTDTLLSFVADRQSRRRLGRGLGRVLVQRDAVPDQPSVGGCDGAHGPRGTRRPTRSRSSATSGSGCRTQASDPGRRPSDVLTSSNGSTAASLWGRVRHVDGYGSIWEIDWPAGTVVALGQRDL